MRSGALAAHDSVLANSFLAWLRHFLTLKKEGKLTSDEARSVVQEVSSSLMTTLHLWGDPSTGKVNQKVVPRPGALWTPTLP